METRTLDVADIAASYDIRTRAFGALPASQREEWDAGVRAAIEQRRVVGAYDGDRLVGRTVILPFRQWWGGRDVPMAGIAGVVVAPEYRGRGVATQLMRATLQRSRELGFVVSALYPATLALYRRLGWEIVGAQSRYTIDAHLLRGLRGGEVAIRQAGPEDTQQILALTRQALTATATSGDKEDAEDDLREVLEDPTMFGYVADDGYVVYTWEASDLVVHAIRAATATTARALWATVGSGSSVARHVHAYLAPDDPIHQLLVDNIATESKHNRWMLRLLDVPAAIAERGYGAGVEVEAPLVLTDAEVPDNSLSGTLRVSGGRGVLVPSEVGDDAVHLDANGMAALYAGLPLSTLMVAGLASGGTREVHALLESAFAGRTAYLLDYF